MGVLKGGSVCLAASSLSRLYFMSDPCIRVELALAD
jgi:hypothetical protein